MAKDLSFAILKPETLRCDGSTRLSRSVFLQQYGMYGYFIFIAPLSDIKYLTMHKVHMLAGAIWLCVCTEDNPLAKARELSSRTYAQTIQSITCNSFIYLYNFYRATDSQIFYISRSVISQEISYCPSCGSTVSCIPLWATGQSNGP